MAKTSKKTGKTAGLGKKPRTRGAKGAPGGRPSGKPVTADKPKEITVTVKVAAAKGRPMLTWIGKRPLSQVTAFPGQLVERHDAINILGVGRDNDSLDERMEVFRGLRNHWNAECWEGQPSPYGVAVPEAGGLLLHGDNLDCLAMLLAHGYRGKVDLIYIDPPFDSGVDYGRKVNLRGAMAIRRWENADAKRFTYHMIFTSTDTVAADELRDTTRFLAE